MARKQIIPAVIRYTRTLAEDINQLKAAGFDDVDVQKTLLTQINQGLKESFDALVALEEKDNAASAVTDGRELAEYYSTAVVPAMNALRTPIDRLEMLVDKAVWPMSSYGDLMFEV